MISTGRAGPGRCSGRAGLFSIWSPFCHFMHLLTHFWYQIGGYMVSYVAWFTYNHVYATKGHLFLHFPEFLKICSFFGSIFRAEISHGPGRAETPNGPGRAGPRFPTGRAGPGRTRDGPGRGPDFGPLAHLYYAQISTAYVSKHPRSVSKHPWPVSKHPCFTSAKNVQYVRHLHF